MKIFEIKDGPKMPCESCMKAAMGEPQLLEHCYCSHRQSGCIRFYYQGIPGPWNVTSPVTEAQWNDILAGYNAAAERFLAQSKEVDERMGAILQGLPDDKLIKA